MPDIDVRYWLRLFGAAAVAVLITLGLVVALFVALMLIRFTNEHPDKTPSPSTSVVTVMPATPTVLTTTSTTATK